MTTYADTSFLVTVIFDEARSAVARKWIRRTSERIIISDLAGLEFGAVASRAVRTGRFDNGAGARALLSFDELRNVALALAHGRDEFELADKFVRNFAMKLSAPDALHLASAKIAGATLATFDRRLAEAALAQGVEVASIT